jgi:hypothetical protein
MPTQRYDIREEPDGTWTVFDVFTGWPAELVDGRPAIGFDAKEADDLVDLMNSQDARRRGVLKRP